MNKEELRKFFYCNYEAFDFYIPELKRYSFNDKKIAYAFFQAGIKWVIDTIFESGLSIDNLKGKGLNDTKKNIKG